MPLRHIVIFICVTVFYTSAVNAQEITLQHKGLTLNADLELAAGNTVTDGVILITHGSLAHRAMETITYLRKLFKEYQYNTLAINLSLGLNHRHGMYNCEHTHSHRNNDAIEEISLWVAWLEQQGVKQVTLLGHSRGGAQTALYAVERSNPLIKAVVLLAPATAENTSVDAYRNRYNLALEPLLRKAKQLVKDGKGDTVLGHIGLLTCRDTSATADTFLSYYGQDSRLDTPTLIPKLNVPTLVIVAGGDSVVVDLDKKLEPLIHGTRAQMVIVDGADHMFRDLYADDAVEVIHEFLQSLQN